MKGPRLFFTKGSRDFLSEFPNYCVTLPVSVSPNFSIFDLFKKEIHLDTVLVHLIVSVPYHHLPTVCHSDSTRDLCLQSVPSPLVNGPFRTHPNCLSKKREIRRTEVFNEVVLNKNKRRKTPTIPVGPNLWKKSFNDDDYIRNIMYLCLTKTEATKIPCNRV